VLEDAEGEREQAGEEEEGADPAMGALRRGAEAECRRGQRATALCRAAVTTIGLVSSRRFELTMHLPYATGRTASALVIGDSGWRFERPEV
jgi:hypothetical protein